jgi:hypothetical protein
MSKDSELDLTVVIRSSGERTVEACRQLVLNQVPAESIQTIEVYPFEKAVQKSFEIGLASNKEWLVTVDADVLATENALANLVEKSSDIPKNVVQIEGYLYDWILRKYRKGGVKLYRTSLLEEAIQLIPEEGETIRPESHTLERMAKKGYPKQNLYVVTGVHDFEQYRKDIYRKSFIHAFKHQDEVFETLPEWIRLAKENDDYKVVVKGIFDGLMSDEKAKIDARDFSESSKKALAELGLNEKMPIQDIQTIKELLFNTLAKQDPLFSPTDPKRFKYYYKNYGVSGVTSHFFKTLSKRFGKELLKLSDR